MILIDNNLSYKIGTYFKTIFEGIHHVSDVNLEEEDDLIIWSYAKKNHLHLLTKDNDFNGIQLLKGSPPKIIWIRSGNTKTKHVINLLLHHEKKIFDFLKNDIVGILEIY